MMLLLSLIPPCRSMNRLGFGRRMEAGRVVGGFFLHWGPASEKSDFKGLEWGLGLSIKVPSDVSFPQALWFLPPLT